MYVAYPSATMNYMSTKYFNIEIIQSSLFFPTSLQPTSLQPTSEVGIWDLGSAAIHSVKASDLPQTTETSTVKSLENTVEKRFFFFGLC